MQARFLHFVHTDHRLPVHGIDDLGVRGPSDLHPVAVHDVQHPAQDLGRGVARGPGGQGGEAPVVRQQSSLRDASRGSRAHKEATSLPRESHRLLSLSLSRSKATLVPVALVVSSSSTPVVARSLEGCEEKG